MRKWALFNILFLLAAIHSPPVFTKDVPCADLFLSAMPDEDSAQERTEHLISYLEELISLGMVDLADLVNTLATIERGEKNLLPIPFHKAQISSEILTHFLALQKFFQEGTFETETLANWARKTITQKKTNASERQTTAQKTNLGRKIEFVQLPSGVRIMPFLIPQLPVALLQEKYFFSTNYKAHVAQDLVPVITLSGKEVQIAPRLPVTNVISGEFTSFLEKLNSLPDSVLSGIINGHLPGARYRLPNRREWEEAARFFYKKAGVSDSMIQKKCNIYGQVSQKTEFYETDNSIIATEFYDSFTPGMEYVVDGEEISRLRKVSNYFATIHEFKESSVLVMIPDYYNNVDPRGVSARLVQVLPRKKR